MRRTASIVSNMTSQSVKEEEAPAVVEEAASVGLCGVMRSGETETHSHVRYITHMNMHM